MNLYQVEPPRIENSEGKTVCCVPCSKTQFIREMIMNEDIQEAKRALLIFAVVAPIICVAVLLSFFIPC